MRSVFQDELDNVSQSLVDLTAMVSASMTKATTAILSCDLKLAEEVIATDVKIDDYQHETDSRIIDIIARQQPVASDLRALVTALRMGSDLERMGDLAHHVAKVARLRHPNAAVPPELVSIIQAMGVTAVAITEKTGVVIATRNTQMALEVERDDDVMDDLHRKLIAVLIEPTWKHGIETAIDLTLLGRYYERYADHAVSISRRVYFLVTGKYAS
ncbi:MAG: phosphate transport system regulatory protein PhoU [Actinobacteria bacterium]|nr:phosphate transport system regulatory protein PhoU [Actinomycetota bacterium]NCV42445.1 phosphate transport system regulatory protein PhoU [Actinomycetota bacterium]NCV82554.1 phosphate transport system regulatory protein PhoU [Actinomycetota bacterium]NCW42897.1 phosphate transport system regulatory protein PhoU [Actinomycetota bacterium]NCW72572.1 phosphate transport system regulatory protein PhoU [Actinomycetota bacterium]